jgi:hypothetical protein
MLTIVMFKIQELSITCIDTRTLNCGVMTIWDITLIAKFSILSKIYIEHRKMLSIVIYYVHVYL